MARNNSFVFYRTIAEQASIVQKHFGKELAYDYLCCIINYGLNGIKPDEDNKLWSFGLSQAFFTIDTAKNRYERAKENGKKGGRPVEFDRMKIQELHNQGKSKAEISDFLGCSVSTIEKVLQSIREEQYPQPVIPVEYDF